jgi:hypothetical protein
MYAAHSPPAQRVQLIMSSLLNPQSASKDGRMALAVQADQDGNFTGKRSARNTNDVPKSSRIARDPALHVLKTTQRRLTDTEESTIIQWMLSMDKRGLPPRAKDVNRMANLLLEKRSTRMGHPISTLGRSWVYNFVRRHKVLHPRYSRKYGHQRTKCEDPTIIREWFQLVQNTITKYRIQAEDIYNFNEIGFQMGVIPTAKVITASERAGQPVSVQPGNQEWITVIESVSSLGGSLPPLIIFEDDISTWYTDIPADWILVVRDKGWTDDFLSISWLTEIFEKHTNYRTRGVYRLLIFDCYGCHTSSEFDLFCSEHKIITLCMPQDSSHLLQPLDVSCYPVLKKSYRRQIEEYMQVGINHIDKPNFLTAYVLARREAIILDIIRSGFAATGLVPYNPNQVLSKLNTRLRTIATYNAAKLELRAKKIKGHLYHRTNSLSTPTEENRQLQAANEGQKRKRVRRKKMYRHGSHMQMP